MRSFDRSDFWFAIILAPFLAIAAYIFGSAAASGDFLANFLPMLGLILVSSLIRAPVSTWGRLLRFVMWFCLGVAAGAVWSVVGTNGFGLTHGVFLGLGLAIGDLLAEFFHGKRNRVHG